MATLTSLAALRTPYGVLSNMKDLGDHYALGSQLLRKDLTPVSGPINFAFPTDVNGNDTMVMWMARLGYRCAALDITGSSSIVQNFQSGLLYENTSVNCGSNLEQIPTYFDSTLGITTGKRLVAVGHKQAVYVGSVSSEGDVSWINDRQLSSPAGQFQQTDSRALILAENSSSLLILLVNNGVDLASSPWATTGVLSLWRYVKATGVSAMISVNSQPGAIGSFSNANVRHMGRTDDGKVWFGACSAIANYSGALVVLDTASETITGSAVIATSVIATQTNFAYRASALSICANDATKYKSYWPVDPNSTSGSVGLKVMLLAKAGQASTNGFVPPTQTNCVLTGGTIPVGYTALNSYQQAGEQELWTFYDTLGAEYVATLSHAAQDAGAAQYAANKCSPSKHALTVFKIDPTDPTKLDFQGQTSDFGAGQTYSLFLRSKSGRTVVMCNSGGFVVMRYDTTAKKFVAGPPVAMSVLRAALDWNGQLFVEDLSRNLYVFNVTTSQAVVTGFDISDVEFLGSPIAANAVVSVRDLLGNRMAQSVQVNLVNAVFTSNGLSKITLTTSPDADNLIPISITGSGAVSVSGIAV